MPIYEFYSPNTHKIYQFYARSLSMKDKIPFCPDGKGFSMEKKISKFAYLRGAAEPTDADSDDPNMDDPKLAGAMVEMEREISRMDPDNPDPRAMGAMMERMSDLTGDKLPADMEEMIGRLKAGEDLESIEEKFGDLMDDAGELPSDTPDLGSANLASRIHRLRGARAPLRDPELYEVSDWV